MPRSTATAETLANIRDVHGIYELGDGDEPGPLALSDDFEHLRWFPLPHEI